MVNGIINNLYMAGSYQFNHSLSNRPENQPDPNYSTPASQNCNHQALTSATTLSSQSDYFATNSINKNNSYDKMLKKIGARECQT